MDIVYLAADGNYNSALHILENSDGLGSFVDTGYSMLLSYSFETLPDTLDVDNDGDTDMVAGMSYSNPNIRLFINDGTILNDGTSNFSEGTQINFVPGQSFEDVFTANFNGDGNNEFMVNTEDGAADSVFLFQENTGSFDLLAKLTGQSKPADLDGDGDDDLFHFDGNVSTQDNQGSGNFVQGVDLITVTASYDIRLVDIDGDGDLDLAEGGGQVSRSWLNDGNGSFSISQEFPGNVYQLAFGDLDGDGDPDMVVALEGDGGEYPGMIIYTNAGGILSYHSNLASGYEVDQVELADMDQDGDLDIVARLDGISNNYIRIFDNTGTLTFSETSSYLDNYSARMALGDIDGDSDEDIIIATEVNGMSTLINNSGLINAGTSITPAGSNFHITDVDLADLDGDGDLDVFASNAYESPTTNSYVFLNNGSGVFTDSGQNVQSGSTYNSFLGDIDSDGDHDLVIGGYISYPQLWVNDGAGNFTFDHEIPTIVTEYGKVLFGDLDADGNPDMVVGDYYGGIKLFFNSGISNALEADSLVLNDIYDTMGGEDWTTATNWGTGPVDSWFGVILNNDGDRVLNLELPNNGLVGTLPASINQLDALEELDLSDNDIDGLATDFSGLTSATTINLDGNRLDFGDLEAVAGVGPLSYNNQQDINAIVESGPIEVPQGNQQVLTTNVNGTANTYQWVYEGNDIAGATEDTYTITDIGRDNMGAYGVNIRNTIATETTISSTPIEVFATAIITANVTDASGVSLMEDVDGYILEIKEGQALFDTLDFANQIAVSSEIVFPSIILGDFLISVGSDPELYVPTYYSNAFLWDEADTLKLVGDTTIQIIITEVPPERNSSTGDGVVSGTIEEDFDEDEARFDARRRAAKRKCGLRRKTGGGRIGQDDDQFELIAYGETNADGEFEYGFLPQGTYRFFVEYPGIPLDESAFVEFEVGPAGVGDNDFKLAVFASEDGISIEVILGASSPYFNVFHIYPNPTLDHININYDQSRTEQLSVQVLDLHGKVLMTQAIKQAEKQLSIDLSELGAGQYLIRIFDENDRNAVLYKVIKK
ncbi:MAG: FG-GAP-like repeat-containing protein [Ekhidna sp.]